MNIHYLISTLMKFIIIASIKLDTNFQQKLLKPQRIHLKYQNNYIIINCLSWNVITREMFFSHFLFAFSKFSFKNRNSIQRQDFTKNIWYLDSALLKYDKKIRQKSSFCDVKATPRPKRGSRPNYWAGEISKNIAG